MNTRQRLLRTFVAFSVALLLMVVMVGWALSAPNVSPSGRRTSSLSEALLVRLETPPLGMAAVTSPPEWEQNPRVAQHVARRPRPYPALLAAIQRALPITARPGGGRVVGQMPAGSPFYGIPHVAWIQNRSSNRDYGKVVVPYAATRATGWIRIARLKLSHTPYAVLADLSRHLITVTHRGRVIMRLPAATGRLGSPTPPGRYFVTDRVPFSPGGPLGAYAFGISGIQPHLPAGWSGGDQLAIHGTNAPSSIGTSATAGCLRVSRAALERLKPLLALGTPVIIKP